MFPFSRNFRLLDSKVNAGVISSATSFNKQLGIKSGPGVLYCFKPLSNLETSFKLTDISFMLGYGLSLVTGMSVGVSFVKTAVEVVIQYDTF